jgi:predicted DNA binding protein
VNTIAEISLPADEFVLGDAIRCVPSAEFEAVEVVSDATNCMPLVRATADDLDPLKAAVATDPTVERTNRLAVDDRQVLFRMTWAEGVRRTLDRLVTEETTVRSALGSGGGWRLRLQFPDRAAVESAYAGWCDADLSFDVRSIRPLDAPDSATGLSEPQFDALEVAVERGFYDVPRSATVTDLAAELGVSHQAVSERLRRGHRTLVETDLAVNH